MKNKRQISEDNISKNLQVKEKKKIFKVFSKFGEFLKKRYLLDGTKTLILVVIILIIYLGVNVLLEEFTLPELDLSANKMFSVSKETKDKIEKIEQDVTITLINGSGIISEDFIEKYKAINKNIKIEKIDDLASKTELMQKYILGANDSLIIVESNDEEITLSASDLYEIDYSTYEQIDVTEEAITNAIVNVTTPVKPKIYFLTNHIAYGYQYYAGVLESLKKEANEVEELDILTTGKIPEDCKTLVISTLKEDLTEQERDCILDYIKNGGNLLMLCGPNILKVSLNNFNTILDEYGVKISDGVLFEQSSSNMLSGYPDIIIEDVQNTSITEKINMTLKLCFVDSAKLVFDEENLEKLGVTYETISKTTGKAYERKDTTIKSTSRTDKDEQEDEMIIAALATKKYTSDSEEQNITSKLAIFGNEIFAMDMPIQIQNYQMLTSSLHNNEDMILNTVSFLNARENTITIRKEKNDVKYTVTEKQHNIIKTIIFTVPVVIMIIGIVIWQIRRRRK